MWHTACARTQVTAWLQYGDCRSATTLKPLTGDVSNIALLIIRQCSTGKCWILAFMWTPPIQTLWGPSTPPPGNGPPIAGQWTLPRHRNCSGTAQRTCQRPGLQISHIQIRLSIRWTSTDRHTGSTANVPMPDTSGLLRGRVTPRWVRTALVAEGEPRSYKAAGFNVVADRCMFERARLWPVPHQQKPEGSGWEPLDQVGRSESIKRPTDTLLVWVFYNNASNVLEQF